MPEEAVDDLGFARPSADCAGPMLEQVQRQVGQEKTSIESSVTSDTSNQQFFRAWSSLEEEKRWASRRWLLPQIGPATLEREGDPGC